MLNKNAAFCWTYVHQVEFNSVIKTLYNLEYLRPYKPDKQIFCLTDEGLGFILFKKDSDGHVSILQVGSKCLKNAQIR